MRILVSTFLLGATATVAHANAFVLNDHGARATGRADAVIATDFDGSAIVHNVAGIAAKDGINVYLGASLIFPNASFTCEGQTCPAGSVGEKTDTESPMAITPQVFVTARVHDLVAVGVGFHTPFGSRIVWPETAPTTDELLEQSLRTYFITPSVALNLEKYVPGLLIGAGVDLVPATVELKQHIFFGSERGLATLGGNGFGIGGRLGVQYRPKAVQQLSVGASWRSPVKIDFDGKGDFDIAEPYRGSLPPDGDISTSITLPMSIGVGAAFRPIPNLETELNAVWMQWSSFDELVIELPDGSSSVSERGYKDAITIRFGIEYALPKYKLDLRAGYMYDPTPIPSDRLVSALPDINRHDIALGASYHITPAYRVDVGGLWVLPGSRETSDMPGEPYYKGTYDVTAFVASLTLSGRFGGKAAEPVVEPDVEPVARR